MLLGLVFALGMEPLFELIFVELCGTKIASGESPTRRETPNNFAL